MEGNNFPSFNIRTFILVMKICTVIRDSILSKVARANGDINGPGLSLTAFTCLLYAGHDGTKTIYNTMMLRHSTFRPS